jgi:hypothetical protein
MNFADLGHKVVEVLLPVLAIVLIGALAVGGL